MNPSQTESSQSTKRKPKWTAESRAKLRETMALRQRLMAEGKLQPGQSLNRKKLAKLAKSNGNGKSKSVLETSPAIQDSAQINLTDARLYLNQAEHTLEEARKKTPKDPTLRRVYACVMLALDSITQRR